MMNSTLTFQESDKVSVEHDNRKYDENGRPYFTDNVDTSLSADNIYYEKNKSIQEFYDEYFEKPYQEYIEKIRKHDPKRAATFKETYLENITAKADEQAAKVKKMRDTKQPKKEIAKENKYTRPVKQLIISLGDNQSDFRILGGNKKEISKEILKEYMDNFEKRNPGMKIVSGAIHCDEWRFSKITGEKISGTVHMHLTYCPVIENCKRGMSVQNSLNQAYKLNGITATVEKDKDGNFMTPQKIWDARERDYLRELARKRNIEITKAPPRDYGNLELKHFQEMKEKAAELDKKDKYLDEKRNKLCEVVTSEKTKWKAKKSELEKKENEIDNTMNAAHEKTITAEKKYNEMINMYDDAQDKVYELLKSIQDTKGRVINGMEDLSKYKTKEMSDSFGGRKKTFYMIPKEDMDKINKMATFTSSYAYNSIMKILKLADEFPIIKRLHKKMKEYQYKINEMKTDIENYKNEIRELESYKILFERIFEKDEHLSDEIEDFINRENGITEQEEKNENMLDDDDYSR